MRFLLLCRSLFFLSCLLLASIPSFSQQLPANTKSFKKSPDGRYNFIKLGKSSAGQRINPSEANIKSMLGLGNKHALLAEPSLLSGLLKNDGQIKHTRFQQYFNNIKVEFGIITAHSKNNDLEIISGEYFQVPENLSLIPAISESTALSYAMKFMGASEYSWQTKDFLHSDFSKKPSGELVICRDFFANASAPPVMRLAYKFNLYATKPLRYEQVYVDAHTGKILLNNPVIKHVDGTAATRYSGNRTISTTFRSGNYSLRDTSGTYNIVTWNMNRGTSYTAATEFTDNDNNWTQQEFDNSNFDNAALDAHWATMMTYDYFRIKHNRNSYDNNGARLNSYVHYGTGYVNAFWNGVAMTYGDGNGTSYFPLTTLDIAGHEIAHAICQHSAGLIYMNESGALNESLSDIWGACVEKFAAPEKNTWLLGDEVSSTGTPFRSMIDPNSQSQPDTYNGYLWFTDSWDNGGVHFNSGVMNHWFYILTEGKTSVNDLGRSFSVSGIGMEKAAAITYRAEVVYLFPSAVYSDARVATLQAAEDLYGPNSNEFNQVAEAWNAVGVYEQLSIPQNPTSSLDGNNRVLIQWAFASYQSVTGFSIERAINGSGNFIEITRTTGLARNFVDSNPLPNSINQYRIRSFRDSLYSEYSAITSIALGNAPFIMQSGTFNICNRIFLDPGGNSNYPNQSAIVTTLVPSFSDQKVRITFSQFRTEQYYDAISVYNGPNTNSPYLGNFSGNSLPPILESTAPGGELTIHFYSSYSTNDSGWQAFITCFRPIPAPSGLSVSQNAQRKAVLQWTDNASDETSYMVLRSLGDSLNFTNYATLPPNTTNFTDEGTPDSALLYYRIVAYRDSAYSKPSNTGYLVIGDAFYVMRDGTVTTCNKIFMDPGGLGSYGTNISYTTTFIPAEAGRKLLVSFTSFQMPNCCDYLRVYNGPSVNSPLMGTFQGGQLPPTLLSTAPNGELTFQFYSDYYQTGPGFQANIRCYKPVSSPTALTASSGASDISLSWMDNADDETSYIVERSVNAPSAFSKLAELAPNTASYNDTSVPPNSVVFYRVYALRDTLSSGKSNIASTEIGNGPFIMKDTQMVACNKIFLDPGGVDVIPANSSYIKTTLLPQVSGNRVRVVFNKFRTVNGNLYVYNGPDISSPSLGSFSGNSLPPTLEGLNPSGALTFVYQNYYSQYASDSGWEAQVTCYKIVARPTGATVTLNGSQRPELLWTDNSDDETKFVIERSTNAPSKFVAIGELPANSTNFIDTSAPANSLLVYRIRAFRNDIPSYYSDTTRLEFGNAPFLMSSPTLVTCDKLFMDPGGVDVHPYNGYSYTSVISPARPGNNLRVVFSKFRLNGALYVYNGANTGSPLIGSYSGTMNIPVLEGTGPTGSLTFVFYGYYNYADSGWEARVTCYRPIAPPSNVSVTADANNKPRVSWNDNSDNEARFLIERSVNSNSDFVLAGEVPPNTTVFNDTIDATNSIILYRIRAQNDTVYSFYSPTATLSIGNAPFIMKDSVVLVCDKVFLDPGGVNNYPALGVTTTTFNPSVTGNKLRVEFNKFKLSSYSELRVFDGPNVYSPLIGVYTNNAPPTTALQTTNSDGSVTFRFYASSQPDSGWVAQINCFDPIARPTGLSAIVQSGNKISLTWADNSSNEENFVVERSVNSLVKFNTLIQLPANSTSFVDSTAPANSLIVYRVRATRAVFNSLYSETIQVAAGDAPFIMTDTSVVICNRTFLDPGGDDVLVKNQQRTTIFLPPSPLHRVRVRFNKFSIGSSYLYVYNGSSSSSPNLGVFSYSSMPPILFGTSPSGSLTFFHSNWDSSDSGWVARVECYKFPEKPANVYASQQGLNTIAVSWTDRSNDETGFLVQRSINSPSAFTDLRFVPANTNTLIDSTVPRDSYVFYRVLALIDTVRSFVSDTAQLSFGNGPHLMNKPDTSIITCNKVVMDVGGIGTVPANAGQYSTTFKPANPNYKLRVEFSQLWLFYGSLQLLNGSSQNSPILAQFYNTNSIPAPLSSTASDGAITFKHLSYSWGIDSGFTARVYCYNPVGSPSGLSGTVSPSKHVLLSWTDNSSEETNFVVERSSSANSSFTIIAQLPGNSNAYIDSSAPDNSIVTYRVKALINDIPTDYSNIASVQVGNGPLVMSNTTVALCAGAFYDPGGTQNYSNNSDYTMTIQPGSPGNRVRVSFTSFGTESCCDYLRVYNGPSTSSPLLGTFNGLGLPPTLTSTAPGGELTFRFVSDGSIVYEGWVAQLSCVPLASPTNLTAQREAGGRVWLQWTNPGAGETNISLERSIEDSLHFKPVKQLPASRTNFIDSTAIFNTTVYYRVRAINTSGYSGYSNTVAVSPLNCTEPLSLANANGTGFFQVNGGIKLTDANCNLFAEISPQGNAAIRGALKASMYMDSGADSALGLFMVKRKFGFLADSNSAQASGRMVLYFTQSEFDDYNRISTHTKLPVNTSDIAGIKNIRILVCSGESSDGSGSMESYPGLPKELDSSLVQASWNEVYSCWEIRFDFSGLGGIFLSSKSDSSVICPVPATNNATIVLNSMSYGTTYQWQKLNGNVYVNISENENYSGTNTHLLRVRIGSILNKDHFRCLVNGVASKETVFLKEYIWTGINSGDWTDPANWSCGVVPDENSDVVIEPNKPFYPSIHLNVSCRSLTIKSGARMEVRSGFKISILK